MLPPISRGGARRPPGVLWRFHDKTDGWRVSLAPEFIALETTSYGTREDFFSRFREILGALDATARLGLYDRLGIRYINRITRPELDHLATLVRPEVLGLAATRFGAPLSHSLCESSFAIGDARLSTRWGLVPANATSDPAAIDPIDQESWILDLDMFNATPRDFDADAMVTEGRRFSETIYSFFRWCVEDDLLRRFGGNP